MTYAETIGFFYQRRSWAGIVKGQALSSGARPLNLLKKEHEV
jgi:hypothetical protein